MASVEFIDVRKSFGTHPVLKGIDITIADGEFVILVGPSGCGKSTLLRTLAGLENISAGEIRINGRPVNTLPPKERDIAMVFQNYALYPHLTVAENILLGRMPTRGGLLRLVDVPAVGDEGRDVDTWDDLRVLRTSYEQE